MKSRALWMGLSFGILIILIAGLGIGAIRKAGTIFAEMQAAQESYLRAEEFRRGIASDMYRPDLLARDYMLSPSAIGDAETREQFAEVRDSLLIRLQELSNRLGRDASPELNTLRAQVEHYWHSLDPVFAWSSGEREARRWGFLKQAVIPNRSLVVRLNSEVARINSENLNKERVRLRASQQTLEGFITKMLAGALVLGGIVAGLAVYRIGGLERNQMRQRKEIEDTQHNLRRLSQRLVQVQEGERRELSRELHDEVGQMLTALGIQLGNIENMPDRYSEAFRTRMEEAKRLNADTMRTIRDLAMGLRPSMLDDIGLEAALQWRGREFSRYTGVPSDVRIEGSLDGLNEAQRTCIYRVVQEALTNCARHARARKVLVSVSALEDGLDVVVQDDGVGFNPRSAQGGLGLLGIQERVQALDGHVSISSVPNQGTTVRVQLPVGVPA
jgi:signal transduction histidine kinase